MVFGSSKLFEKTLDVESKLNLENAQMTPSISGINFDENKKSFWATIDRVLFKRPFEVITTILTAQGYVVNLENVLSCIDQFCFGARAKVLVNNEDEKAKVFAPAISFNMPNKKTTGPLLQLFYNEIAGYEAELAKLQANRRKDDDLDDKSEAELRREVSQLRVENEQLLFRIQDLATKLEQSKKLLSQQEDQLGEEQLLPEDLRLAKVTGIYAEERSIALRAGRSTLHFPMALADTIPQRGDACLVAIVNGIVKGAFFYQSLEHAFEKRLAKVLFVKEDSCKIRDRERVQWVLNARNDTERALIRNMRRGHEVVVSLYENQIIKIQPVVKVNEQKFVDSVQESIALQQLVQIGRAVETENVEKKIEEAS